MFLFSNGVVVALGQENDEKLNTLYEHNSWKIIDCPKMKTISCGSNHTIGITFDNKLALWGNNASKICEDKKNPGYVVIFSNN